MRQVVSLIKDNQAHFALVDDESGELIPFADLLIPDPDRFGLHESALLGTNLIDVLGLNGTKRPKAPTVSLANVPPTHREVPEPEALGPVSETPYERKLRMERERKRAERARKSDRPLPKAQTKGGAQWYVTPESITAIVNEYPEGIRVNAVADRIWREAGNQDDYPGWIYTAVMNRLLGFRARAKDKGIPMPFTEEDRPIPTKDGKMNGATGKFLVPLPPVSQHVGTTLL